MRVFVDTNILIDSIQYHSAVASMAECIVTRNKKDFKSSLIPVFSVEELLNI